MFRRPGSTLITKICMLAAMSGRLSVLLDFSEITECSKWDNPSVSIGSVAFFRALVVSNKA